MFVDNSRIFLMLKPGLESNAPFSPLLKRCYGCGSVCRRDEVLQFWESLWIPTRRPNHLLTQDADKPTAYALFLFSFRPRR